RTCGLWLRRPTLYPAELRARGRLLSRPRACSQPLAPLPGPTNQRATLTAKMKDRGSAFSTRLPARVILPLAALVAALITACIVWWATASLAFELPDLDTIRRWIR